MSVRGPLLGFNDNVAHRGATFHVQTEDLGPRRRQLTTHLFADGGRIVHTERASYADLGDDAPSELVRQQMKDQHRRVVASLRDGDFDRSIDAAYVEEDDRGGYRFVATRPSAPRDPAAPSSDGSDRAGPEASPVAPPLPQAIASTLPSAETPSPPPSEPGGAPQPAGPTPSPPPGLDPGPAIRLQDAASPHTLRGGFGPTPPPVVVVAEVAPSTLASSEARMPFPGPMLGARHAPGRRLDELVAEFLERRRERP
ncbi:MAG: hypothetical protein FJ095_06780 [Deltaproteobacteria bacterium]|nr:hypothetical protein [Deltaproteobacteria bacterium]